MEIFRTILKIRLSLIIVFVILIGGMFSVLLAAGPVGTRNDYPLPGLRPTGVAFDNVTNSVWVADFNISKISKVDIFTGSRIDYPVGVNPESVVFDNVTNSVWVANFGGNSVSKVNIFTGDRVDYPVSSFPVDMHFDSSTNLIWVTLYMPQYVDPDFGTIYPEYYYYGKIDIFTGNVIDTPTYGGPAINIFDSITNSVWSINQMGNTVNKQNVSTGFIDTYPAGNRPMSGVIDTITESFWVTNYDSANVSKFDVFTGNRIDYPALSYPQQIVFDNVTNSVWVKNYNPGVGVFYISKLSTGAGSVNVSSNNPVSSWTITRITSPRVITGSGISQSTFSKPGVYTITWNPISGYNTPAPETQTLTDGGTITFNGTYTAIAVPPTVASPTDTSVTSSGATLGANITSDGGVAITARGTCWGTAAAPTTNCLADGATASGVFTQARTGMAGGTSYYYRGYAVNSVGTGYSADGTFTTDAASGTTIGDGTNPGNVTVAPESGIVDLDSFTLVTSVGTDSVTALTVTLAAGTNAGLSEVRITDSTGATTYFSAVANPASTVINFSGGTAIPVSTTATTYKIRITPKTHANMPAPSGASYATAGTVTAFTSTNTQSGTDSTSATITVDNLSPNNVTSASATAGNTQVTLNWTNPGADFSNVLILRNTVSILSVPAEGSSPLTGTNCGGTCIVAYVGTGTSYIDTGLTNGTPYHYKIFAKDTNGNYSTPGTIPTGSPAAPVSAPTVSLTASPTAVSSGGSSIISWSSPDATSCSATTPAGWTASTATSGSQSVTVTNQTTYYISCTGPGGSTPRSVTISIANPVSYAVTQSGVSDFQGWAWGSDVLGWMSFNSINCDSDTNGWIDTSCGGANNSSGKAASPYKVYVVGTLPCSPPTASALQSNFTDRCVGPFSPTIGFTYKDNQLNPLAQYTVRIYDSAGPALVDTFTVTYCDSNNNNYIDDIPACGGMDNASTPLAYSGTLIHAGSTPPIPSPSGISVTYNYQGVATLAYGHSYYYTVTVQSMCNLN